MLGACCGGPHAPWSYHTGQDFHSIHIPKANLHGAALRHTNLEGANLNGADIRVCRCAGLGWQCAAGPVGRWGGVM